MSIRCAKAEVYSVKTSCVIDMLNRINKSYIIIIIVPVLLYGLYELIWYVSLTSAERRLLSYDHPVIENRQELNTSYNYIIILTDDQYYKTLEYMPNLMKQTQSNGIIFENAFATNPECCPFRASMLSGGYHSYDTGVKTNGADNGSLIRFNENKTLATWLQEAGYSTGFIGKYMHGYTPGYVPPGWDYFVANEHGGMLHDWINLKNITYGSSRDKPEVGEIRYVEKPHRQYLTDFQEERALEFLDKYGNDNFFLFVSLYSPHTPAVPEFETDREIFSNAVLDCINEDDISDKPLWVKMVAENISKNRNHTQKKKSKKKSRKKKAKEINCNTYAIKKFNSALQSVDRLVASLFSDLDKKGLSDKTIVFFLSDNGVYLGHNLIPPDKGMPYERSIRIPFVMFHPQAKPHVNTELVAGNLDIGATIFDIMGIKNASDGESLLPLLQGENHALRDSLLIENYGYMNWRNIAHNIPLPAVIWSGLRTKEWKYIEYTTGEKELYSMVDDPQELTNLIPSDKYAHIANAFSRKLSKMKGLAIVSTEAPVATANKPYEFKLAARGGKPPYTWSIKRGELPPGLSLNSKQGVVSGSPNKSGEYTIYFKVVDSGIAKHSKKHQTFTWPVKIQVE